jgi:arabinoxylan arabinofuranohydrolase
VVAFLVSLFCITALLPGAASADNPIVQHIYTADPAPLVYNGRVYHYP